MEQNKKEHADTSRIYLANSIDFYELAALVKNHNLLSSDTIELIVSQNKSSISRNLKLMEALEASELPHTFEKFLRILDVTSSRDRAPVVDAANVGRSPKPEGMKSIIRKMADKYKKSLTISNQYPLGMNSFSSHCMSSSTSASRTSLTVNDSVPKLNSSHVDNKAVQSGNNQEPVVCFHSYPQAQGNQSELSSPTHNCNPSFVSTTSGDSDSSTESALADAADLLLHSNVTTAIAREATQLLMNVKLANVCHNNPHEDYKMTGKPRGPCLIVNNIDFEGELFPTRKGSDEDARRFDDIFQQLGFTVIMRRNQTADQMRKLFKDVAAECREEHDALVVFILSHGSEHGIYGSDGLEVYLESEIISCFDNRNCKAMLGKPKVFVIQACRGRAKDCGGDGDAIDSIAWPAVTTDLKTSQENRVPDSWLKSNRPQDGKKRKHPIRTDMLIVFSCLSGYVSVRNEAAGSWLGVALAYFIMTYAHERDLLRILNLVTSDVIQRESSHGHIQSIELKLLGWTKNLYFNPGIYV